MLIVSTADLDDFLFGYDWVVIGGVKPFFVGTAYTVRIDLAVCALGFLLIHRWLPETKDNILKQIEASWG